jgi:hypothetical protein
MSERETSSTRPHDEPQPVLGALEGGAGTVSEAAEPHGVKQIPQNPMGSKPSGKRGGARPPPDGRRCRCRSKTTGKRCGQWAVRGGRACHYHGGKGGRTPTTGLRSRKLSVQLSALADKLEHDPRLVDLRREVARMEALARRAIGFAERAEEETGAVDAPAPANAKEAREWRKGRSRIASEHGAVMTLVSEKAKLIEAYDRLVNGMKVNWTGMHIDAVLRGVDSTIDEYVDSAKRDEAHRYFASRLRGIPVPTAQ